MIKVHWKADLSYLISADRNAEAVAKSITQEFAEALVEDIKSSWSASSPSAPGQPPAIYEGELDESIRVDDQTRTGGRFAGGSGAQSYVRVGSDHAMALETGTENMAARPYLTAAVERMAAVYGQEWREFFARVGRI